MEGRYRPILKDRYIGINFLFDQTPELSDDYYQIGKADTKMEAELQDIPEKQEEEVEEPQNFEYDEEKQPLKQEWFWN